MLLLTSDAYGANGGIALYNRDITEALVAMPDVEEVVVIARGMPMAATGVPPKVRLVAESVGGKTRFVKAALRASTGTYGLVICGHVHLLPVAAVINQLIRAPLVLMVYGIDVWQPPYKFIRQWLKCVDAIWSISAVTTDRMNAWARLPNSRFSQLPNAIHLERYGIAPRRADLVARYGLSDATVIMTLARLSAKERYKGHDEVIELLPALLQDVPNLKYMIAGDGDDRLRLEAKATALGVADRVVFAGMIEEADKADYLRLADAFVMPGTGEGFGFVFLEALSCGVPVVGSQLDGSRDALRGGELGELADPTKPATIHACTLRALQKPCGIPAGLAYFAWPQFNFRLVAAVRSVIAGARRRSHSS